MRQNDLSRLQNLLDSNVDVNSKDIFGRTPLFYAAENNSQQIVELLLKSGADKTVKDRYGSNVLHFTASFLTPQLAVNFLDISLDLDKKNRTPLYYATLGDNLELIKWFVDNKANLGHLDKEGQSILHVAAEKGSLEVLNLLKTSSDFNVDQPDFLGNTPLFSSLKNPNNLNTSWFLLNGADVNHKNENECTFLHFLAQYSTPDLAANLLERTKIDLNCTESLYNWSPLFFAVHGQNIPMIRYLVESGANLHQKDKHNCNLLHVCNSVQVAQALLDLGLTDINAQDDEDWTPLFYAVSNNNFELVKLFLAQGFSVTHKKRNGRTITHIAAALSSPTILQHLIQNGAPGLEVTDENSDTPLYLAILGNNLENFQWLLEKGANVHHLAFYGNLLHCCAERGNASIAELILQHTQFNIDCRNSKGVPPLFFAVDNYEMLLWLLEYGADVNLTDCFGRNVLHYVACLSTPKIYDLLSTRCEAALDDYDDSGCTPLFYAIWSNNLAMIEHLKGKGANVYHMNSEKTNILHHLALEGSVEAAEAAFDTTPNVEALDCDGNSPLFLALKGHNVKMFQWLLEKGADVKQLDKYKIEIKETSCEEKFLFTDINTVKNDEINN